MASAFLKLNEAQAEDEEMPSQFTLMANHIVESPQGAKDTTKYPGLHLAFESYATAHKFIMHCSKVLMVNTEERARDIESSVPYSVKQYQKTPEFISEKLLHIFDSFKETGLCHMCDQVKIKAFNAEALARLKYETDKQPKTPLLITSGTPANTPTDADTPAELH